MQNLKLGLVFAGLTVLGACGASVSNHGNGGGDGNGVSTFSDQSLSGKISGKDWTFVSGRADKSMKGDGYIMISLWSEKVDDPCGSFARTSNQMLFGSLKRQVGLVTLSPTENVTLYDVTGNQNTVLGDGAYEVTELTAARISGRIRGFFDKDNTVNGTFSVPVCAD